MCDLVCAMVFAKYRLLVRMFVAGNLRNFNIGTFINFWRLRVGSVYFRLGVRFYDETYFNCS